MGDPEEIINECPYCGFEQDTDDCTCDTLQAWP